MSWLSLLLVAVPALLLSAWWTLALWYRLPGGRTLRRAGAVLWSGLVLSLFVLLCRGQVALATAAFAAAQLLLALWWHGIRPSNVRRWADEVAELLHGEIDGDTVTLAHVRNFGWRSVVDYDARWETRRYALSGLRSVDVLLSHWMGPAIAHTLVSFGFDDGRYLAFSIEIRKERGEAYSALGGFFKQFEAILVAADERDIVRLRSNVRGEDVYLYRLHMPAPAMRSLFLAYLAEADALRRRPRWYQTATGNCTTIVFEMARRIVGGLPLDYRLLLSGYLPEYLYRVGALTPGVDLATLRRAGRIAERARAADAAADFSARIRRGVPGIDPD